jgi:hypothetical protein
VSLNGTLDYRKPKPAPTRLSGDEGIEQSVTNLRRDAGPLVSDEYSIRASRKLRLSMRQLMRCELPTLEQDFSLWRRRLNGVEEKIEDRAVHEIFITFDGHWS